MSHLRKITMSISNPNIPLVKEAVKEVAKNFENVVFVTNRIPIYSGTAPVVFGFKANNIRGLGIRIERDGSLAVVGDDWAQEYKLSAFETELNQKYTQLAVAVALQKAGCSVNVMNLPTGAIMVKGVLN